jgi:hypothetical protein
MNSGIFNVIQGGSFNDPSTDDTTTAPAIPQAPQVAQDQPVSNPLAKLLAKKKQQKQKQSSALLAAIRRSRSARPSSEKFG